MTENPMFVTRSDSLAAARAQRWQQWFGTRHWRVMTEVTERRTDRETGSAVIADHGEVWIEGDAQFQTPLGNKGRHGFLVTEVGPDGRDLDPAVQVIFGYAALCRARDEGAVAEVPSQRRRAPRGS
jgi:hypothetical protein